MLILREIRDSVLHLLFPHVCNACGSDLPSQAGLICLKCISSLPRTYFENISENPVEKMFWGRLNIEFASSQFYFSKQSRIQQLMHQLKYKGNKDVGIEMGKLMGEHLLQSSRFFADAVVPLPLFEAKERARGYNQATLISQGAGEILKIPVLDKAVVRKYKTETQTKKNRVERWANIEDSFEVINDQAIKNKHILLIDDVITTGATLESCGSEILKVENTKLSIATLCVASRQ